MDKDLISIVIPIYNSKKDLKECINSVLRQTYKNLEIILLNDGSTDKSSEICEELQKMDNRIIYIKKQNTGVSDTRNLGIDIAKGKYIFFIDSDDSLEPSCIEELYNNSKQEDLVICNRKKIDTLGNVIKGQTCSESTTKFNRNNFINVYKKRLLNPPFGKLYRRDIVIKNNIRFDINLSLGEDLLFNLEYISFVKEIIIVDKFLYNYRVGNNNSLSRKYYPNMFNIQMKICEEFSKFFDTENNNEAEKEKLKFYTTIISNEYHNTKANLIKRYINARKLLTTQKMREKLYLLYKKKVLNKVDFFLLKNGLYIIYRIKQKL